LQALPDLKGKRIAFARGSSAHNMTIAAIEKAGLTPEDVQLVSLAPADAAAAFERGAIDAWTIWDPFYAIYEDRPGVRTLVTSDGIAEQNSFLIGSRSFVTANPGVTAKVVAELARIADWGAENREAMATLVSDGTGLAHEPSLRTMRRYPFRIVPITAEHVRSQQAVADRFQRLGIIPARINVADQVWRPNA
jgi:NitT/TauT family transport system substrate-binding protein/sulfonate transport system substrate-binding protein